MRVQTDRSALVRILGHVHGVAAKSNGSIPVLACARLTATATGLTATATDMELAVTAAATVTAAEPGECITVAGVLHDIVRKLPDGAPVTLAYRADAGLLDLVSGRFRTSLATLPIEDFPATAAPPGAHAFTLPAAALRTLIDRTRFAMSSEETRYYLCGLYLVPHVNDLGMHLRAVATDGHRLALIDIPRPDGLPDTAPGIIVPRRAIIEMRKLLADATGDIAVSLSDTRITVTTDQLSITSKLIDGTFPEYERVIPRDGPNRLRVARAALSGAAARVAAIDSERTRGVKLTMNGAGVLIAAGRVAEGNAATEELDAAALTYEGDALEIGFQARYLADITDQCGTDIELLMSDGLTPATLRDPADRSALFVLMPMRM